MEGGDLLGNARGGDRQRHRATAALGRDEIHDDEQRPVVVDDPAALVDESESFGHRIEARAERRAGRSDELAEARKPLHVGGERLGRR